MASSAASSAAPVQLPSTESFAAYLRISPIYNSLRSSDEQLSWPLRSVDAEPTGANDDAKVLPFAQIFNIYGHLRTAGHVDDFYEDLFIMYQYVVEQNPNYTDEFMLHFPVDALRRLFVR